MNSAMDPSGRGQSIARQNPDGRVRLLLPSRPVAAGALDGKVALITGAASGQGRAASVLFAAEGARIVVADLDDEGAAETVRQVKEAGTDASAVHTDVSRRADCDAMIAAAVDAFGRLDVLYNNAAVQMSGRLVETTEEQWDLTIATNLSAIFWACRAAIPRMLAGDGGAIVNTASVLGLIGSEGYAAYGAAKAGLVALTRQIAVEFGPRVRANVIAPGSIDTPRFRKVMEEMGDPDEFVEGLRRTIPLGRLGVAEDVAHLALFLASDASAYTSGAVIPGDGGLAGYR
jgi:NAD(P)-dependent dehydrogenase (short-subunit alcohol dehydrogenase family)